MTDNSPEYSHGGEPGSVPPEGWLVRFRPWLGLIARMEVESRFQGKFDASDVVQQTLMEAWQAAPQFRGKTEAERIAWLRKILAHVLAHEVRRYQGTQKRNLRREFSIEKSMDQSSRQLDAVLASALATPSQQVAKQEQEVMLAAVIDKLPAEYREVIILRNLEGLSHSEVAERMGRSPGAIRMLWVRALQELRAHFPSHDWDNAPES